MKIVVLDGYTLNPGDLSWQALREAGDLAVYDRTPADLVYERSAGAGIILTNKTVLTAEMLQKLPGLKYVGVLATGYNVIDTVEAGRLGITVTNIPAYSTDSVAQLVFAFILELCFHVQKHSDSVHAGEWQRSVDFSYRKFPLAELASKTIGIIGYGNIGKKVGGIATAFGMNVVAYSRSQTGQPPQANFRWVTLPELFSVSDIVTVHCPLTPETKGLINAERLALMKKTAFLINTSRGPVVSETDLAEALNTDVIAGAGLDVLSSEPPSGDNPLLTAKNCIITPHIAWATLEARTRLMEMAVANLKAFLSGNPVNVVH